MNLFKLLWFLLPILSLPFLVISQNAPAERKLENPVFVFNNAFFKNGEAVMPYEQQAKLLKQLGFAGIEHRETDRLLEMKEALEKEGLQLFADYLKIDIDEKDPYLPAWKTVIPKLVGTNIILWAHIHSQKYDSSDKAADQKVVAILQELADLALPYGVRIAIYPHVGFLAEKVEDSFRLAKKTDRDNVGSVFNLCHFLKTDDEANLAQLIDLTLPKLFAVSINGADYGNTREMGWDKLIQPLGSGSLDVYRMMELLCEKGYKGPIGIQCYALPGQPESYLKQSSEAWHAFQKRYAQPHNKLTNQEKKTGWELLYDGQSANGWRGINKKAFPCSGWETTPEAIITGKGEQSGGDIITTKEYGQFILKWEWKMETKGGNSGIKYFVKEIAGEKSTSGYGYGLEYQILDDQNHEWMLTGQMQPNDFHTMGALYEIYPASAQKHANAVGLWNQSKIVSRNNRVEHWLNGQKILEYDRGSDDFKQKIALSKFKDVDGFGLHETGHILIQDHNSVVHFRNMKIKEL